MKRYYLDLFAGIGGFALGAWLAGVRFDGHYFSEIDKYASSIYTKHFPDAIGLGDIKGIMGRDLPEGSWVLSGGFPCQDISSLGKRLGLDGSRSGLWWEYARLIGEVRPRFALVENVGDLAVRGLDRVLGSLAAVGYDAVWQDICARDVGAPHRRERLWLVAYPSFTPPPRQ
ncbi:MAG: DNA cytosine methyltransferase [Treponema sp.]|jgi:DNA (cytosine-5)-methyltransferase 1|nr:DNA cytosine methyltransferase [Treponema sp.]